MENLIEMIRDLVNEPRRLYRLIKDAARWNQICSCMDAIGDACQATAAYPEVGDSETTGARYLAVYGVLQALVIQQDAVRDICEALDKERDVLGHPRLQEIRDIRVRGAGHPTKQDRPKKKDGKLVPITHHQTPRVSINSVGFDLVSASAEEGTKFSSVRIPKLVQDQDRILSEILREVVVELRREDEQHRERFREEKLEAIFQGGLGYAFEKVFAHTRPGGEPVLGPVGLSEIRKAVDGFRLALARRGIELDTYDSIKYEYEWIEYPLQQIDAYFRGEPNCHIVDPRAAYIFVAFVQEQMKTLQGIARELDEDYTQ